MLQPARTDRKPKAAAFNMHWWEIEAAAAGEVRQGIRNCCF